MSRFVCLTVAARRGLLSILCGSLLAMLGCGTTTTGTATEQLLISDAVDQAIGQIDFQVIAGQKVYLDTAYFKSLKSKNFIDSDYITSSIRQQLTAAGCLIQEKVEDADIVVEPRVGALGTDGHEITYGIPQNNSLTTAASVLTNAPMPRIPEISVGKVNAKSGIAKLIVFAYDRESRTRVWQSGIAKAESTSKDTWMFGAGPFQKGSIHKVTKFAGKAVAPPQFEKIVFKSPFDGLDIGSFPGFPVPFHSQETEDSEDAAIPVTISDTPPNQTIPLQNEYFFMNDPATEPASDESPVAEAEAEPVKDAASE